MLESNDISKEERDLRIRKAYKAGLKMRGEFNTSFAKELEELSLKENNARKINNLLKQGVKALKGKVQSVPVGHQKLYSDNAKMNAHPSALRYLHNDSSYASLQYNRDNDSSAKESFVIYTPEGDHPEIENWAIAFELGHYFLHPNDQDWYMGGADGVKEIYNDEAAAFSVAFLLPNDEVKKQYDKLKNSNLEENKIISKIAGFFGVWNDLTRRHVKKICI